MRAAGPPARHAVRVRRPGLPALREGAAPPSGGSVRLDPADAPPGRRAFGAVVEPSMRTEYTRQTRWAYDPELQDEEQAPPGSIYVKQVIWVACNQCDLQVHSAVTQSIASGVLCP